jgi:hypothetical protein
MSWGQLLGPRGAAEAHYRPSQPYQLTATQHAGLLHPSSRPGRVAVARMITARKGWTEKRRWKERTYPIRQLPEVLGGVAGEEDVYFSPQRFDGWRRIARLRELGALAVDVDYYRVEELGEVHPLGILEDALVLLERARIPAPSLVIASGRGLYLLWLHNPVPRRALPRWNAAQRHLHKVLKPLGADRAALDSARVLRAVGTRNSKTGRIVEALSPVGEIWDFDTLADEVLPISRAELYDLRIQRAAKGPAERPQSAPQGFNAATLWEARLADLQILRKLRHSGPLPPGKRNFWLFIAGVAMSWLAPPDVLTRELLALASEVGGWDERETGSRMSEVMKRARQAANGEHI